jgi:hypothetical protein
MMPEARRPLRISARSIGASAATILDRIRKLSDASGPPILVDGVFERSFILRSGADFMLVADRRIGPGPLTVESADGIDTAIGRVNTGDTATLSDEALEIGCALAVGLCKARLWRQPAWPARASRATTADARDAVIRWARRHSDDQSLLGIVVGAPAASDPSALARTIRQKGTAGVATLRSWLAEPDSNQAPALDLLGLGPGLTPAGDDLLAGALVMLAALESGGHVEAGRRRAALGRAVAVGAAHTTPWSHALLREAAAGRCSDPLFSLVAAIASGNRDASRSGAEALARVGYSSGRDTLAGILLALEAIRIA